MKRLTIALFLICALGGACGAQEPPNTDRRNTELPNTQTHMAMPHFDSLAAWTKRKQHLRKQILSSAGLYPMPEKTPLHPQIFGRVEEADYTIEKVLLETMPGYYLGGNLYRPRTPGPHPAILNPQGHWQYGRLENQPLYSGESFGVNMAKLGFVVFAYDMVGYTDTIQTPHLFGTPAEQLWSFTPLGLQLWNSTRGLDFLSSLEGVDASKIGMVGASGGGTQTFLLAAVDDRIAFAAPVNMVSGIMQGGDVCENAPGLRVGTNNVEIAAMFAPKPMLLVSATGDWTRNVPREEFPAIRSFYELYGNRDAVEVVQIDAKHNFNEASRTAVYRFFAKRALLRSDTATIQETEIRAHMLQQMMATSARALPANALSYDGMVNEWKQMGAQALDASDVGTRREALRLVVGAEWPVKVNSQREGERIVLGREGAGDRVAGLWIQGRGLPVLVIDPGGAEVARGGELVRGLIAAHRSVLLLDTFQTGAAIVPRDRSAEHFLTFNRSDDQGRVQDIVTAIAFLQKSAADKPVEVYGSGPAAVWTTLAAAVVPVPVTLRAKEEDLQVSDTDLASKFVFRGLQRAGGMAAARALVQRR